MRCGTALGRALLDRSGEERGGLSENCSRVTTIDAARPIPGERVHRHARRPLARAATHETTQRKQKCLVNTATQWAQHAWQHT